MTQRDKDKINALFTETMVWAENNKDVLTGLDGDCEEVNVECLTISDVMMLLETLKRKILNDGYPDGKNVSHIENTCKDITF